MTKLNSLQCIRATAAIFVVLFHLQPYFQATTNGLTLPAVQFGFIGVDVFFVLSGFVITYTSNRIIGFSETSWFLIRRFSRVYLGYWPFLIPGILVTYAVNPQKLNYVTILSSIFLINKNMNVLINGIAWSLVYELFFYFCFAFLLLTNRARRLIIILYTFTFILVWNMYWQLTAPNLAWEGNIPGGFFSSGLFLEFLAGCLVAYAYEYFDLLSKRNFCLVAPLLFSIGAISLMAGIYDERIKTHELFRAAYLGTSAVCTMILILLIEVKTKYQFPKFLVKLGNASFVLYLSHEFFYDFVMISHLNIFLLAHRKLTMVFWLAYLMLIFLLSYLYHQKIELVIYKKFLLFSAKCQNKTGVTVVPIIHAPL